MGLEGQEEVVEMDESEIQRNMRCELLKLPTDTEKLHGNNLELGNVSLDELHRHDVHNTRKLISVHGVVFDVSENLEKYAPDGEYFFFTGRDITWPLSVTALNGEYADLFYHPLRPDHLRKVYGWMEYYADKYEVVGYLTEYDKEDAFEPPPEQEEEPEMECCIM
mmetsp:Transcript_749/g.1762  ORF Transcript_749/g.1762 Transcript_749/m.1762 type:complete len:165 (+) Transcript_749:1135-1629(+)